MISLDSTIILKENVFVQEIDNEMVLLDMDSDMYFGLDSVGSSILGVMQKSSTLRDISDKLLDMYDVSAEVLTKDLLDFVGKLEEKQLIEVR